MFAYFDIGGTKTRIAVSEDGHSFRDPVVFATPKECSEGVARIASVVRELAAGRELLAAGGGIAGPMGKGKRMLVRSPNLPDWAGKPLAERLEEALGAPVFLENDSAIVGLGEAHHGAGKGFPIVAYITVSTGVGGVRIVHGSIDQSAFGFEPGHQFIDIDKTVFPLLNADEAEEMVSGTATAERFHKKAYEVQDPAVWEELARLTAYMLTNTIVHWSPHVVVLGGSMIVGDPAIPVPRIGEHLRTVCTIFPELPVVAKASLKDIGGLYGAMEYVREQYESKETARNG